MCGIALILSEAVIPAFTPGCGSPASEAEEVHREVRLADDLKVALGRRGPDSIGSKKVFLWLKWGNAVEEEESSLSSKESSKCVVLADSFLQPLWPCKTQIRSPMLKSAVMQFDAADETGKGECFFCEYKERKIVSSVTEIACAQGVSNQGSRSIVELHFLGATLQLRGICPVAQPLIDDSGNILVYNGEIFGGINVDRDENDGETLLHALERCACCSGDGNLCCIEEVSIPDILSSIKGPWALIYWQAKSKTLWFGRDAFGRRSLLVHWPTDDDPQFVLSSVSPLSSVREISAAASTNSGFKSDGYVEGVNMMGASHYWDELSCGLYSVCLVTTKERSEGHLQSLIGGTRKHEWTSPLLKELVKWDRKLVDPKHDESFSYGLTIEQEHALPSQPEIIHFSSDAQEILAIKQIKLHAGNIHPAHKVLIALRESVTRRTALNSTFQADLCQTSQEKSAPVALLFSGGLDSMILAALLDQCLNSEYSIDLLNISFDGVFAPDRISARAGLKELQRIAPSRRWRLVEIDADLSNLSSETKHVTSLINPARTYMDLNIGISLWLAAGGEGFVDGEICSHEDSHRYKYKSMARILFVGSGADEQCAGYGRHRTKYRLGGWASLQEEMRLDMQRIWIRNMGRDDRCISDHGKEARFPFLDEDVVKTLLEIPLWEIAELDEPVGRGDKKILREVARLLGLEESSLLPKRAIQFGSRIARESNKMHFGSNRAANQASAGMVMINKPSHRPWPNTKS